MTKIITMLYGDAMEITTGMRVDAVITDPDYNSPFPLSRMMDISAGNILCFSSPFKRLVLNPDDIHYWVKPERTMNYAQMKRCGRFVEEILVIRHGNTFNQLHWSQMSGVWNDRLICKPEHPYQKPLSLMVRLILLYTNEGDLVLDPFMGSGTTMLACRLTGRRGIGIENNPTFYDIARRRYENQSKTLESRPTSRD